MYLQLNPLQAAPTQPPGTVTEPLQLTVMHQRIHTARRAAGQPETPDNLMILLILCFVS
jgi:hypothetical protein